VDVLQKSVNASRNQTLFRGKGKNQKRRRHRRRITEERPAVGKEKSGEGGRKEKLLSGALAKNRRTQSALRKRIPIKPRRGEFPARGEVTFRGEEVADLKERKIPLIEEKII